MLRTENTENTKENLARNTENMEEIMRREHTEELSPTENTDFTEEKSSTENTETTKETSRTENTEFTEEISRTLITKEKSRTEHREFTEEISRTENTREKILSLYRDINFINHFLILLFHITLIRNPSPTPIKEAILSLLNHTNHDSTFQFLSVKYTKDARIVSARL